jgi:predicted nucleotidyltransferase
MGNEADILSVLETFRTDPNRKTISWLPDRTILLTRAGSRSYGTSTPSSDTDFKGICIEPLRYYTGFDIQFEQATISKPDTCIFSLRKFFKLAADCNPNVIETLYTAEEDWLIPEELSGMPFTSAYAKAFETLYKFRNEFLSKKARHTFSGYAMSQLHRIKRHYAWHTKPPDHEPTRKEFGLPDITLCPMDQLVAAEAAIRKHVDALYNLDFDLPPAETIEFEEHRQALIQRVAEVCGQAGTTVEAAVGKGLGFDANFLDLLDKERAHKNARLNWEHYQQWKSERNPARAELEAKYGYDTKHAMHLVRLLRMGREVLQGKGVIVRRPDAKELLEIRAGALTYQQLIDYAEGEEKAMIEDEKNSRLPKQPDRRFLNQLCVDIYQEFNQEVQQS